MGSVPELGRSHMLWSNLARAPQLLKSTHHNRRSDSSEKPMPHNKEQPSLIRDQHRVVLSAVVSWSLNHWTTSEVPLTLFYISEGNEKGKKNSASNKYCYFGVFSLIIVCYSSIFRFFFGKSQQTDFLIYMEM